MVGVGGFGGLGWELRVESWVLRAYRAQSFQVCLG